MEVIKTYKNCNETEAVRILTYYKKHYNFPADLKYCSYDHSVILKIEFLILEYLEIQDVSSFNNCMKIEIQFEKKDKTAETIKYAAELSQKYDFTLMYESC